jgi:hypothetical protein
MIFLLQKDVIYVKNIVSTLNFHEIHLSNTLE